MRIFGSDFEVNSVCHQHGLNVAAEMEQRHGSIFVSHNTDETSRLTKVSG